MSARWADLTRYLSAQPGDRVVIEWDQFDRLVGGLPASAAKHAAWWSGERPHTRAVRDAGFAIVEHVVGRRVVFQRVDAAARYHEVAGAEEPKATADHEQPDLVLVGCVKEKRAEPAQAQDLYVSALFRKARRHVEAMDRPWYILSAEHGLLKPSDWVAPYYRRLSSCTPEYRAAWAGWVVAKLTDAAGSLDGKVVEIHAGLSYVDPLLPPLQARGVRVHLPLAGLPLGPRLAWYDAHRAARAEEPLAGDVVLQLRDGSRAMTPEQLLATDPGPLRRPGLYSWWADESGARDLTTSLGHQVDPGLIYAGLAGATRSKSGRPSTNTLWGRLVGMHLGQRAGFSTFRLTLGSALFADEGAIDEVRLTKWMHDHLRVVAVPVDDADTLDELETAVLTELDPPLNLSKMPKTDLRRAVSAARRRVRDSI